MRILVVDDSGFMRQAVKKMLESGNHTFYEANNEDNAIMLYKEQVPDIVFMDVMMTRGDGGLIALKAIRETNPGAKVVIVTALDPENTMVKDALEMGAIGVIKKPFSKEQLEQFLQ